MSKLMAHYFGHAVMIEDMHPEDIKAALRKKYGSIRRFVCVHKLPTTGVSDLFRGRSSKRVSDAIESALSDELASFESTSLEPSKAHAAAHRLSAEVE